MLSLGRLDKAVDIGRVRGTRLRVQLSAALLPVMAIAAGLAPSASGTQNLAFMTSFVLLLYVCALAHELGHIFPATRFGAKVTQVRLSWAGIFVRVEWGARSNPTHDLIVALSGPLVSAFCTLLLGCAAWFIAGDQPLLSMVAGLASRDRLGLLTLLAITNGLLTLFNLIPLFPMDGGMAVRAALAHYVPAPQATHVVSTFGQVMAMVIALAVFALTGSWLLRGAGVAIAGMLFSVSLGAVRRLAQEPVVSS